MRVPRLSEALLRLVCRDDVGRDVIGDLAEEMAEVARRRGLRAARRWYRRQAMRSVVSRALPAIARLASTPAVIATTVRSALNVGPAARSLRRAPWYSTTIVVVVALSLALATTVFAVVDGVLFRPLPYADPARLVLIDVRSDRLWRLTPEMVERWEQAIDVPLTALRLEDATGLERLNEPGLGLAHVRENLFDVLGVRPLVGGFSADDLAQVSVPRPPVRPVLITYAFWQQRFGGALDVVGQIVAPVNPTRTPVRIAGVLPPDFVLPARRPAQLLMPSPAAYADSVHRSSLLARLPEGLSAEAFRNRLQAVLQREAADAGRAGRSPASAPAPVVVVPIREGLAPWERPALGALFAAVLLLVSVACLNASGLMTARCLDRARDISLRRAIGARGRDIASLVLAEHLLLFVTGATLGLAAAPPLLGLVVALLPPELHLLKPPVFDVRVALFAALAVAGSLAVSSAGPIRRALRLGFQQVVAGSGGGPATGRTTGFGSRLVITGQVAGTIVLVVAGGLLVGSLLRVKANQTGYQTDDVIVAELGVAPWLDGNGIRNRRNDVKLRLAAFMHELRAIPGVTGVGAADVSVLVGSLTFVSRFDPVGRPPDPSHPPGMMSVGGSGGLRVPVTPGFFAAAGIQALEGRLPTDEELEAGQPVVAVSRSFARAHFTDGPAIGQWLQHSPPEDLPVFEIVGIVEDPRLMRWDGPASSAVLVPYATFGGDPDPVLFVRAAGAMARVIPEVIRRAELHQPFLRPVRVRPAAAMLGDTIRVRRLQSWLFGSFAAAGLVIAAVGLLGLVGMAMARRTREIGIRMALGATRDRVVSGLVREQLVPVLAGLAGGALLAAWAVRFLEAYVYELSVYDARVWGVALAVVTITALTGALVPSLRASRVDPVRALRVE